MVRLKVLSGCRRWSLPRISIPYGSIKSWLPGQERPLHRAFQFLMVRLKGNSRKRSRSTSRFQFLMVRLKAPSARIRSACSCISIPYGSIKSCPPDVRNGCKYISIPYGSIKSSSASSVIICMMYFNSLWFD